VNYMLVVGAERPWTETKGRGVILDKSRRVKKEYVEGQRREKGRRHCMAGAQKRKNLAKSTWENIVKNEARLRCSTCGE